MLHQRNCVLSRLDSVVAVAVSLETLDGALERRDFGFEFGDALDELLLPRCGRGIRLREGKADLVGAAPLHAGGQRLLPLRDLELDDIGNGDGLRKNDACAVFGQVAHQAGRLAASFVEINDAAQETLLPPAGSAFVHLHPRGGIAAAG